MLDLTKSKNVNFPSAILVDGKFYSIDTSIKAGIEFSEELKKIIHNINDFDFLYKGTPPEDRQAGLDALYRFFFPRKELPRNVWGNNSDAIIIDYKIDADLIYSAFMKNYNIDLLDVYDSMHWYKFRVLFDSLRDCKLVDVMGYRSYNDKETDYKKEKLLLRRAWEIIPEVELTEEEKKASDKFDELCKV